jgi:hypothetical protein
MRVAHTRKMTSTVSPIALMLTAVWCLLVTNTPLNALRTRFLVSRTLPLPELLGMLCPGTCFLPFLSASQPHSAGYRWPGAAYSACGNWPYDLATAFCPALAGLLWLGLG